MADHTHPSASVSAVHGMLIVGVGPIFLSHLPMFHRPHDHQLIIEVEFAGPGDPHATYVADRSSSGESIYTWVPRPFVLTELLNPSSALKMQGTIFRGHFERDGTPITAGNVQCSVKRLVHAHPLSAAGPRDTKLRYLIFGPAGEFAAHMISGPPDFDHIISVTPGRPSASTTTVVIDGRGNDSEQRIRKGERVRADDGSGTTTTVEAQDEIYLELGDLKR